MSAAEKVTELDKGMVSVRIAHAVLAGRVAFMNRPEKKDGFYKFGLILPAADAYSSPETVEVYAKTRVWDIEQDVRAHVRIGGFRRTYKATDRDTGEMREVRTADNRFYLVE